eukprot:scaffold121620_cov28-Tisochrysis_lutea.AAC.3
MSCLRPPPSAAHWCNGELARPGCGADGGRDRASGQKRVASAEMCAPLRPPNAQGQVGVHRTRQAKKGKWMCTRRAGALRTR